MRGEGGAPSAFIGPHFHGEDLSMSVNGSQCESLNLRFTHALLPPFFLCVFVAGTVSNACGLWSMRRRWGSKGSLSIFMLNLGVADLLYLSTLPFLVHYYAHDSQWQFGQPLCKLTRFCFNLNLYGSIGFLTCISVTRYLGIVHPMRVMGMITNRHSLAISALVWILVIVQILPDVFFEKNDETLPNACFDTTSDNMTRAYLPYSVGWSVTGFAVPLLIIVLCYGHIVLVLVQKAQVNPKLKQRSLRLVVILLILFSVCFIPYHVLRSVNLTTRVLKLSGMCHSYFRGVYMAHQVGRCLACLNSAINPLVYVVGSDDLFVKVQNCCRSMGCRSNDALTYCRPVELHVASPIDPQRSEHLLRVPDFLQPGKTVESH